MGYSSLGKLQRAAFHEIKIDREFCVRAKGDRVSRAAVQSVIALARALDAVCVAEGIEDEDTRRLITDMGCGIGQGWLFSRPLAPEQVLGWWQSWRPAFVTEGAAPAAAPPVEAADAPSGPAATLDERSLARLAAREEPAWIFDLDRLGMVWANAAALRFWGAPTLDALRARDFRADMTIPTRERLQGYRAQLRDRPPRVERWTLFPEGRPATVDCLITGLYTPAGRASMLIEAAPVGTHETGDHHAGDCARAAAVAMFLADADGSVLWQNPASTQRFGGLVRSCADFAGPRERWWPAFERALAEGEAVLAAGATRDALPIAMRRARDSGTGRAVVVMTVG